MHVESGECLSSPEGLHSSKETAPQGTHAQPHGEGVGIQEKGTAGTCDPKVARKPLHLPFPIVKYGHEKEDGTPCSG